MLRNIITNIVDILLQRLRAAHALRSDQHFHWGYFRKVFLINFSPNQAIILRSKPYQPIDQNKCREDDFHRVFNAKFAAIPCARQGPHFLMLAPRRPTGLRSVPPSWHFRCFYRVNSYHVRSGNSVSKLWGLWLKGKRLFNIFSL